jgi:putative transposase
VKAFLDRPIGGSWPYLWIDATYVKVRESGRIVSVAVIIAVGVNSDGRREVLGMAVGPSEAEPFWTKFLRDAACAASSSSSGMPTRAEGGGCQGAVLDRAALPRALHEECARPRRSLAASDGGGRHPHRLHAGDRRGPRMRNGALSPTACESSSASSRS